MCSGYFEIIVLTNQITSEIQLNCQKLSEQPFGDQTFITVKNPPVMKKSYDCCETA